MLLGWGAAIHSPTIDEIEWLPGGWASWQTGRFGIVSRNPPHVGLLAAMPLLLTEHDASAVNVQGGARAIGRTFIQTNGYRSFWLFTLGRWACIPFSVLGAIACFAWARELYGDRSGILAATLWCFCPNILAHGQLVAHDVPATSLGVLACYAFWRWLRQPNVANALLAGVGLGFALLTKMTVLLYFILWPAFWACWCVSLSDRRRSSRVWLAEGALLATSLIVALDILNLGYGLHGTLSPLGSYSFHSSLLKSLAEPTDRFPFSLIRQLPVPLPAAFVSGLDTQRYFLEGGLGAAATYCAGNGIHTGCPTITCTPL